MRTANMVFIQIEIDDQEDPDVDDKFLLAPGPKIPGSSVDKYHQGEAYGLTFFNAEGNIRKLYLNPNNDTIGNLASTFIHEVCHLYVLDIVYNHQNNPK